MYTTDESNKKVLVLKKDQENKDEEKVTILDLNPKQEHYTQNETVYRNLNSLNLVGVPEIRTIYKRHQRIKLKPKPEEVKEKENVEQIEKVEKIPQTEIKEEQEEKTEPENNTNNTNNTNDINDLNFIDTTELFEPSYLKTNIYDNDEQLDEDESLEVSEIKETNETNEKNGISEPEDTTQEVITTTESSNTSPSSTSYLLSTSYIVPHLRLDVVFNTLSFYYLALKYWFLQSNDKIQTHNYWNNNLLVATTNFQLLHYITPLNKNDIRPIILQPIKHLTNTDWHNYLNLFYALPQTQRINFAKNALSKNELDFLLTELQKLQAPLILLDYTPNLQDAQPVKHALIKMSEVLYAKNMHNKMIANSFITNSFQPTYQAISKELAPYAKFFKDKVVLCNYNDSMWSNFTTYFLINFETLGLKELITIAHNGYVVRTKYDTNARNNLAQTTIKYPYFASYHSQIGQELINEADLVISMPDFKEFKSYFNFLTNKNKQFIIIGLLQNIFIPEVFKMLQENKLNTGFTTITDLLHKNPYNQQTQTYKAEAKMPFGQLVWYTNLPINKNKELTLKDNITKLNFIDDTNILYVPDLDSIPANYNDLMSVPMSYINYHNAMNYTLVGQLTNHQKDNPYFIAKPVFNKQTKYDRLVIKKIN